MDGCSMTKRIQQPLLCSLIGKMSAGWLFCLLPLCILAGSLIGYHNPPDHPRYDSMTWVMLGGLSGLLIGSLAIGLLTLVLRMLLLVLRELDEVAPTSNSN
jgi:hypothetical protein